MAKIYGQAQCSLMLSPIGKLYAELVQTSHLWLPYAGPKPACSVLFPLSFWYWWLEQQLGLPLPLPCSSRGEAVQGSEGGTRGERARTPHEVAKRYCAGKEMLSAGPAPPPPCSQQRHEALLQGDFHLSLCLTHTHTHQRDWGLLAGAAVTCPHMPTAMRTWSRSLWSWPPPAQCLKGTATNYSQQRGDLQGL